RGRRTPCRRARATSARARRGGDSRPPRRGAPSGPRRGGVAARRRCTRGGRRRGRGSSASPPRERGARPGADGVMRGTARRGPRTPHGIAAALALVVLAPASEAAAGPWAPEPGHGYAKLWLRYLYGFDYRAGDGTTYGYGAYHEASLSVYA